MTPRDLFLLILSPVPLQGSPHYNHGMKPTTLVLAAALVLPGSIRAQDTRPVFAPVEDAPGLPRVLLIGDSISIGYTLPARALLAAAANVHRIPVNGGPTPRGVEQIDSWLGKGEWDAIHFNWGLHDLKYMADGRKQVELDVYERNLERLVERLQSTGAKLIWASTTPVPDAPVSPPRKNAEVEEYNAVAARIMRKHGVPVNDLYAFALPRLADIQREANVHFLPEGSKLLAEQVAAAIRKQLKE